MADLEASSTIEATFYEQSVSKDGKPVYALTPFPKELKIDGAAIITQREIDTELETLAEKTILTRDDEERLAVLQAAARKRQDRMRAVVTFDEAPATTPTFGGRTDEIKYAEWVAGIERPLWTVWVDGAENTPGKIEFGPGNHKRVYVLKEIDGKIKAIDIPEHKDGEHPPARPYFTRDGRSVTVYMDGFSGSGTEADPFIVSSYADLCKVGTGTDGWYPDCYYEQDTNITAPQEKGTATGGSTTTLVDTAKAWDTDEFAGKIITYDNGTDTPEFRTIESNTATTIIVSSAWNASPSEGVTYRIFTENFPCIGDETTPFSGSYNGGGYEIQDIFIDKGAYYSGIFGYQDTGSIIENVKLIDVFVLSLGDLARNTGPLCGRCYGTIRYCSATGYHGHGSWYIGGFIGYVSIDGYVNDCKANVRTQAIDSGAYRGAFAGRLYRGTVIRCYSLGYHSGGGSYNTGFIGAELYGTYSDNYASNINASAVGATLKNEIELKDIDTFTNWNIAPIPTWNGETWGIDDDNDYPVLWYEIETGEAAVTKDLRIPYDVHIHQDLGIPWDVQVALLLRTPYDVHTHQDLRAPWDVHVARDLGIPWDVHIHQELRTPWDIHIHQDLRTPYDVRVTRDIRAPWDVHIHQDLRTPYDVLVETGAVIKDLRIPWDVHIHQDLVAPYSVRVARDIRTPWDVHIHQDMRIPWDVQVLQDLGIPYDVQIGGQLRTPYDVHIHQDLGVPYAVRVARDIRAPWDVHIHQDLRIPWDVRVQLDLRAIWDVHIHQDLQALYDVLIQDAGIGYADPVTYWPEAARITVDLEACRIAITTTRRGKEVTMTDIVLMQGDTWPYLIDGTLKRGGTAIDLTDATVTLTMKTEDGETLIDGEEVTVIDVQGRVQYRQEAEEVETTGRHKAVLEIAWTDGRIGHGPNYTPLDVIIRPRP